MRKRYYLKNKQNIAENYKRYKLKNKEKRAEYSKRYYLTNKNKIIERTKIYYKNNIDKIKFKAKLYASRPYTCICGRTMRHGEKSRHMKSKIHKSLMAQNI